ncbi:GTP-binding protein [Micromonospora echinospora]
MSSSPQVPTHAVAADADTRPSLTVLSGFWPAATFAVARTLLATDPTLLLVRHDLAGIRDGVVRRVVRSGTGIVEDEQVELRHGCVSCTLREDVLPTLVRLTRSHPGQDLVLVLPELAEPEAVAAACAHCLVDGVPVTELVRVDSYVTVVDAEHLLDCLASTDDLTTLALQAAEDDHRALADVVVRQIEYADTLVLWGQSRNGAFDTGRLSILLHRMAPWAAHVHVDGDLVDAGTLTRQLRHTHRHRLETPGVLARGLQGYPLGIHQPEPDYGVVSAPSSCGRWPPSPLPAPPTGPCSRCPGTSRTSRRPGDRPAPRCWPSTPPRSASTCPECRRTGTSRRCSPPSRRGSRRRRWCCCRCGASLGTRSRTRSGR